MNYISNHSYIFDVDELKHSSFVSKVSFPKMSSDGRAVRAALTPGHFLFTSESVGEGHPGVYIFFSFWASSDAPPDKICDQVSDAIVSSAHFETMKAANFFSARCLPC